MWLAVDEASYKFVLCLFVKWLFSSQVLSFWSGCNLFKSVPNISPASINPVNVYLTSY